MKVLHLFCYGFAFFVATASIFAQSNEPTPPLGKDFKSILIVPAKEPVFTVRAGPYAAKPLLDFRAHFCQAAPMDARFWLQTAGPRPPEGQKRFPISISTTSKFVGRRQ